MKTSLSLQRLSFALCLLVCSFASARVTPTPTVSEHFVNGYRVILVNHHDGNRMKMDVHVPTGSWHDDPILHAGRAHLWEHDIHRGSVRFPDGEKHALRLGNRSGGKLNAYTASDHTLYYGEGHPDALVEIAEYIGAMISNPLFAPADLEAERKVVMKEALQYQASDDYALLGGTFLSLLPHQHPLAMYDVGTQDQLQAMDLEDLKDLFYANYRSDLVTIIIAGNFDTTVNNVPPLNRDKVFDLVAQNFKPTHDPRPQPKHPHLYRPSNEIVLPSIIGAEKDQLRMVEIAANSDGKTLQLFLEIPEEVAVKQKEILETAIDYLNLELPGSFLDQLRSSGWIADGMMYLTHVNNLHICNVTFELTEAGAEHRRDIVSRFLSALRQLRENGIKEDVLNFIRTTNINDYTTRIRTPKFSTKLIVENLRDSDLSSLFDFQARYGHITNDSIREVTREAFHVDKMLVGYIGDDVTSKETLAIFDRPYRKVSSRKLLNKWRSAFARPQTGEVLVNPIVSQPLFQAAAQPQIGPSSPTKEFLGTPRGMHAYLSEDHRAARGALSVELKTAPPTTVDMAARFVFEKAFELHHKSVFGHLRSLPMDYNIAVDTQGWVVQFEGNSLTAQQALSWALKELSQFRPTDAEIDLAKQFLIRAHSESQDEFPAVIALDHAYRLLDRFEHDQNDQIEMIKLLPPQTIRDLARIELRKVDIRLVAAGDYTETQIEELTTEIEGIYSQELSPKERENMRHAELKMTGSPQVLWKPLSELKTDEDFGNARIFKGPPLMSREAAALRVATPTIASAVYELNRVKRGLGYVHDASLIPSAGHLHLTLFGETSDPAQWERIAGGWSEIADEVRSKGLGKQDILDSQIGLVRAHQLAAQSHLEVVAQIIMSLDFYGDAQGFARMGKLMSELTVDEIQATAAHVLSTNSHADVVVSQNPPRCANVLMTETELKSNLFQNQ